MTADIQTMLALSKQLIEAGKQLEREATQAIEEKAEQDLVVPETKDFLSEFSWEISRHGCGGHHYAHGTPITDSAKTLIESVSASIETGRYGFSPKTETLRDRLSEWGDSTALYMGTTSPPRLIFHLDSAHKLASWLQNYSHLKLTNSPDSLNEIRHVLEMVAASAREELKTRRETLETLTGALGLLPVAVDAISLDLVDWDAVGRGKEEAPRLLNFSGHKIRLGRTGMKAGEWIYVGPKPNKFPRIEDSYHWGWDHSKESKESAPEYTGAGLSREEAIAQVDRYYATLYRYQGEGIAELVHSKNLQKDETEDPILVDAIDWNEVAYGKQQAPKLLSIIGDRIDKRSEGDWIYVGLPEDLGNSHWGWDYSDSHPAASGGLSKGEAISYMKDTSRYSALYQYRGEGIAELVASKQKS